MTWPNITSPSPNIGKGRERPKCRKKIELLLCKYTLMEIVKYKELFVTQGMLIQARKMLHNGDDNQ